MRNLPCAFLVLVAATILSKSAPKEADIRSINFKNFSFPWDHRMEHPPSYGPSPWHWSKSLPESKIQVVNGMYRFYEPNQSRLERERAPLLRVHAVVYGDLNADGTEDAAIHLNYSTGGTQNWDYLYIYRLVGGHPEPMGILKAGSRADGGLYRTAIQNGLLVLDFADAERRAGDCCSEGYIRVRYRWRNGAFVEEGAREHGDIDLNQH
jgi:hypothetical protein